MVYKSQVLQCAPLMDAAQKLGVCGYVRDTTHTPDEVLYKVIMSLAACSDTVWADMPLCVQDWYNRMAERRSWQHIPLPDVSVKPRAVYPGLEQLVGQ